jgi:hypothetical protein
MSVSLTGYSMLLLNRYVKNKGNDKKKRQVDLTTWRFGLSDQYL